MDHRSDLYSLAVCLYELITGERLFVHAGLTTTADEIYSQAIPLVSRKVPGLPADLDKVMLRALSIDPDARYQTAGEFQEAVLRCAHRNGLMMSAPELAQHLREVCGPPSRWREEGRSDATGSVAIGGGGTEVYDALSDGTEQIDLSNEPDEVSEVSEVSDVSYSDVEERRVREMTSMDALGRLQNIQLTSMIKFADTGDDGEGAAPLVDLDDFGAPPPRADDSEIPRPVAPLARPDESEIPRAAAPPRVDARRNVEGDVATEAVERVSLPRRSRALPWILSGVLLLLGGTIAAAIGLSGPTVAPAPPVGPGGSGGSELLPAPAVEPPPALPAVAPVDAGAEAAPPAGAATKSKPEKGAGAR
jgi:hypothetical protein